MDNRRTFIKNSLLFGGSLMLLPRWTYAGAHDVANGIVEPLFVEQVIVDEAVRLVLRDPLWTEPMTGLLRPDINAHVPGNTARLARHCTFTDAQLMSLLTMTNQALQSKSEHAEEKAALAIGCVAFRAARQTLKKMPARPNDASAAVYLDAAVLKRATGRDPIKSLPGAPDDLFQVLEGTIPRVLTRFHTLIPDGQDPEGWVLRLDQWRNDLQDYLRQLSAAIVSPDAELNDRFVSKTNFIREADPVLRLLDAPSEKSLTPENKRTLAAGAAKSVYARAVVLCYQHIGIVADLMKGSKTAEETSRALKLG